MITLYARAKINLSLDIVGKRNDGYHLLRGVMQSIALYDKVTIKKIYKENYLKVVTNSSFLPTDARNIAYKTAELLINKYGIYDGVFIDLEKNIPVSAGLAGGSADCAAVLSGMRDVFDLNMSFEEMLEIGLSLGADVPFCLTRGTLLTEGIGEKLERLKPMPNAWVLLVKQPVSVSTAEIFKAYGTTDVPPNLRPDVDKMLFYIKKSDLRGICGQMANILEPVTAGMHPEIWLIKEKLLETGALGAVMSGSGPTVFGIYEKRKTANETIKIIQETFPNIKDIILTKTFNA